MSRPLLLPRRHANRDFLIAAAIAGLAFIVFAGWIALRWDGTSVTEAVDDFGEAVAGLTAALACYAALAFELEGQRHSPVLPTFRVGRGRDAVLAEDPARRIDGVSNEAGVRQTS